MKGKPLRGPLKSVSVVVLGLASSNLLAHFDSLRQDRRITDSFDPIDRAKLGVVFP